MDRVTLQEIRAYHMEGHFPAGSMGPKIDAAIRFLDGKRVIIGQIDQAMQALNGETGTRIVSNDNNSDPFALEIKRLGPAAP